MASPRAGPGLLPVARFAGCRESFVRDFFAYSRAVAMGREMPLPMFPPAAAPAGATGNSPGRRDGRRQAAEPALG